VDAVPSGKKPPLSLLGWVESFARLGVVRIPVVYRFIRKSFPHHVVSFIADKMCFLVCRYV
jgi:hypothetical protein